MKRADLLPAIRATNGKIFNVVFTKKDGSLRHMTCRLKVKKHVKDGPRKYDAKATPDNPIIGVIQMTGNGDGADNYRCVYTNSIQKFNGETVTED